ncbi:hypothetical protein M011DRAFT_481560 [Sporormia fimetaria CBS 119925]|uniref:DUF7136 domain-containing protein n=1 Tax=Sporormia fimetaria CBS 119925 TaxID=1340428 RepID=A0A6A6UWX4_9PLEO|nr:hypothetical protein M011DRAFT_481560 [Sporormia fimetaria CBS 119925]
MRDDIEDPFYILNFTTTWNDIHETTHGSLRWKIGFESSCYWPSGSLPRWTLDSLLVEGKVEFTITNSDAYPLPTLNASSGCSDTIGSFSIDGELEMITASHYMTCPVAHIVPKLDDCGVKIDDSLASRVADYMQTAPANGHDTCTWPNPTATSYLDVCKKSGTKACFLGNYKPLAHSLGTSHDVTAEKALDGSAASLDFLGKVSADGKLLDPPEVRKVELDKKWTSAMWAVLISHVWRITGITAVILDTGANCNEAGVGAGEYLSSNLAEYAKGCVDNRRYYLVDPDCSPKSPLEGPGGGWLDNKFQDPNGLKTIADDEWEGLTVEDMIISAVKWSKKLAQACYSFYSSTSVCWVSPLRYFASGPDVCWFGNGVPFFDLVDIFDNSICFSWCPELRHLSQPHAKRWSVYPPPTI